MPPSKVSKRTTLCVRRDFEGELRIAEIGRRVPLHKLPIDAGLKRRPVLVKQRNQFWRGNKKALATIESDQVAHTINPDRDKFWILVAGRRGPAQQTDVTRGAVRRYPRRDHAGHGAGKDVFAAAAAQPGHAIKVELQKIAHLGAGLQKCA